MLATVCMNSFVRTFGGNGVVGCVARFVGVSSATSEGGGTGMLEVVALDVGGAVLTLGCTAGNRYM